MENSLLMMKCWRRTCNSRRHASRPLEEESSLWALLVDPLGRGWRHLGFATHEDEDEPGETFNVFDLKEMIPYVDTILREDDKVKMTN